MSELVTTATNQQQVISLIERALTDPSITPEKLNGLYDFKERMDKKNAEIEATQAFQRVLKRMPRIRKNGVIDFGGKNKAIPYAKWEDVHDAIKPIYEEENFTLSFDTVPKEGSGLICVAKLLHENGHLITSSFGVPLDQSGGKQPIQGMGSSGSYGVRYATRNLFNLVFEGEDDDGRMGSIVLINEADIAALQKLLKETNSDTERFLQNFQVSGLEDMQKKDYARALNMLMTKKAKMAG